MKNCSFQSSTAENNEKPISFGEIFGFMSSDVVPQSEMLIIYTAPFVSETISIQLLFWNNRVQLEYVTKC